jgi:transposase
VITIGSAVGKRLHQACFVDAQGQVLGRPLRFATTVTGVRPLEARVQALAEPAIIALEASGHSWRGVHRHLTAAGLTVHVINPWQTEAFRATGIRKTKTDRRDAQAIADLVRIGRVRPNYVPDDTSLQLRALTRCRWGVVDQLGDAKRRLLTVRDRVFPEVAAQFTDPFGASGRALLTRAASAADVAALDLNEVTALLERVSRRRFGREQALALQQAAADSLGVTALGAAAGLDVRALLAQLRLLEQQVVEVDQAIAAVLVTIDQYLTTIPGIGPVLAATILAEIGDVGRFERLEAVVAYAGLDPSGFESGQFHGRRQHIATRGSPYLRRALFLAAHSAQLHHADLRAYLDRKVAEGKPYRVALIALAHTLLARCYVVLKEHRPYQPR